MAETVTRQLREPFVEAAGLGITDEGLRLLKDKIDTAKYNLSMLDELEDGDTTPNNLETKIVKEGLYINHTIATIVFAVLCVSKILKTSFVFYRMNILALLVKDKRQ